MRNFLFYVYFLVLMVLWMWNLTDYFRGGEFPPMGLWFLTAAFIFSIVLHWTLPKHKPELDNDNDVDEEETSNLPASSPPGISPVMSLNPLSSFYATEFQNFASRTGKEMKLLHNRCDELQLRCNSLQTQVTDLQKPKPPAGRMK